MSCIQYIDKRFNRSSLKIIEQANAIIGEYAAKGFSLTLRQLYYQFVSRDLLANQQTEYKRLGQIVNDARMAGLMDWEVIEDRTRNVRGLSTWNGPEDVIDSALHSFRHQKWRDQPYRPEVWIEKDALVGVITPICNELQVDFFACRGYTSQSEQWRAGQRFQGRIRAGQVPVVLHLGDHDPSGIDMTRDNSDRLNLFVQRHVDGQVIVRRLALNMNQVEQYEPPPNPAKQTDSRHDDYVAKFGNESWELDALNPEIIADLIRDAVYEYRDPDLWAAAEDAEEAERKDLIALKDRWSDVVEFLRAEE